MPKTYILAIDDSGTRHPDHKQGKTPAHGHDWFGLGGILFDEDNEPEVRRLYDQFHKKWPDIRNPLHSSEIRAKADGFSFLKRYNKDQSDAFYEDLYQLMADLPVIGHACVIDRPGYNARYYELHGRQRWSLCKTAFSILVERAAKIAINHDAKLRVYIERSDKKTDGVMREYYNDLRAKGPPFRAETSSAYDPLEASSLSNILYEFRTKNKTSPLMQFADIYLWPICIGGYDVTNRTYARLISDKKLVDVCSEGYPETYQIKYSCFDNKKPD